MVVTNFISNAEYKNTIKNDITFFDAKYCDITNYVDIPKLKRKFNLEGKIRVIVTTINLPEFTNIANPDIYLENPICCDEDTDGAVRFEQNWICYFPVGNAWVVC